MFIEKYCSKNPIDEFNSITSEFFHFIVNYLKDALNIVNEKKYFLT